ncbi:hypothetical protein R1flu_001996 [Riccia fluitans]|uniref:Uncharacterized protein n=1 Tax=Riccia fluitans TaxID=41844 RepID=A0ABD1Y4W1_9MARC
MSPARPLNVNRAATRATVHPQRRRQVTVFLNAWQANSEERSPESECSHRRSLHVNSKGRTHWNLEETQTDLSEVAPVHPSGSFVTRSLNLKREKRAGSDVNERRTK